MQNRASCQRGRYIPRRHAIRSFRYAFANARDREASEKKRERKKKGRVADWAAMRGRERSIFIRDVRETYRRERKGERARCARYTHTHIHALPYETVTVTLRCVRWRVQKEKKKDARTQLAQAKNSV